jgi:hypothetical protein
MSNNNDIDIFKKQINIMIDNLETLPKLGDVNLVFEGGSLNGYYLIGVAMFLKELERRGVMRVSKVSGTSVGAYIGFHYLNDTLHASYTHSLNVKQYLLERLNLSYYKEAVTRDVSGINPSALNGRLFITYYDVIPERKRVVQSEYDDVSDLRDSLCATSYLPFLMDGRMTYSHHGQESIDGGLPYLFDDANEKTMYVKLSGWNKLGNMFSHRGEKNGRGRVCEGIVSAYNFFLYGETGSDMCSWINNWSLCDRVVYGLKEVFCLIVSLIICVIVVGWKWFLLNNPGYDAIVERLMSDADISILIAIRQKIADTLKDLIVILVK